MSSYFREDTIAALATGLGGAVAIVRLSGPRAIEIARRLSGSDFQESNALIRIKIKNQGKLLDEAMGVVFRAPASFTGEDMAEIHLHGSGVGVSEALGAIKELGAQGALPGEFAFRAVRNGKITLLQAQAIDDLVKASSSFAHQSALKRLGEGQSQTWNRAIEGLRDLMAHAEAGIDFSDQDAGEDEWEVLRKKLNTQISELRNLSESYRNGRLSNEGICLAILGKPNAGKSSLFNAILGEDRSIVADQPGTTRDTIKEQIELKAGPTTLSFRLIDTAGLRVTSDEVESAGVRRSLAAAERADIVVYVQDPRNQGSLEEVEEEWRSSIPESKDVLVVLSKSDLWGASIQSDSLRNLFLRLGARKVIETTVKNQNGITELLEGLGSLGFELVEGGLDPSNVITRIEQRDALNEALSHLARAQTAATGELFAADLRHALYALSPFVGKTVPEDILNRIFATFCIGK